MSDLDSDEERRICESLCIDYSKLDLIGQKPQTLSLNLGSKMLSSTSSVRRQTYMDVAKLRQPKMEARPSRKYSDLVKS